MTDDLLVMFTQSYQTQQAPWDTGITPPEVIAFLAQNAPGKALDLGCGTGTNVRTLLEHGWQADGVDFVPMAIDRAHEKLVAFPPETYGVFCHDVTRLEEIPALRKPYDLIIDIGCGHGVPKDQQAKYAADVAALLAPGGVFLLFSHAPTEQQSHGWTPADVDRLFSPHLTKAWQVLSDDTTTHRPSAWYRWEKK